jgi:hypothetical protein
MNGERGINFFFFFFFFSMEAKLLQGFAYTRLMMNLQKIEKLFCSLMP